VDSPSRLKDHPRVPTALLLFAGFLLSGGSLASADTPEESSLQVVRLDKDQPEPLESGATIPRSAEVAFDVRAHGEGDYLYLIQRREDDIRILMPATGLGWLKPESTSRVVPIGPHASSASPASPGWNADQTGLLEFLLVASVSPRDVPSDSRIESLERFLLPPPFVRGELARPARVIASFRVNWLEQDPPD
jgi:hypothetical protein